MKKPRLALAIVAVTLLAGSVLVWSYTRQNSVEEPIQTTIDISFAKPPRTNKTTTSEASTTREPEDNPNPQTSKQPDIPSTKPTNTTNKPPEPSVPPTTSAPPTAPQATKCTSGGSATSISLSNQILDLVNTTRIANGIAALNCKNSLVTLAEIRAQEIIAIFSHTRPNGQPWYTVDASLANGENLAIGYSTAGAVFDAWMASPGHKTNILRPEFKSMGVGYIYTELITNVPADACPDGNDIPGDEETECDRVYYHHVAQIFSVQP